MSYFCVFLSRSEPGTIKCTGETIRVSRRDVVPLKNGDTKCYQNQPEPSSIGPGFYLNSLKKPFPFKCSLIL